MFHFPSIPERKIRLLINFHNATALHFAFRVIKYANTINAAACKFITSWNFVQLA